MRTRHGNKVWRLNRDKLLTPGMTIRLPDGKTAKVLYVSDCAASIRETESRTAAFKDELNGQDVAFTAAGRQYRISKRSEVEILYKEEG